MSNHADKLLRPTWVEISLSKLRCNYQRVRKLAGARKIMAVVKADAYGHGAVEMAQAAEREGVAHFGVATLHEGIQLRQAGVRLRAFECALSVDAPARAGKPGL